MSRKRLGLAGCGRIAERGYLPALNDLPDLGVVAVADPDPERGGNAARAVGGAVVFADAEAMIEAGGIDALVVAVPAGAHLAVTKAAAEAGIPSLVEKPPAPDLAAARELAALDPSPAIAFNRRFMHGVAMAPGVPTEGWLEMELELRFRRRGWGAHASDDEALLDAGTHLIDLAAFLADSEPIAVRRAAVGPERASLELELGRARARIECATDRSYAERVEVRDRAGRLLASSGSGPLRASLKRLRGGEDPLVVSLRRQLESFSAQVDGRPQGELADGRAGAIVMSVVEAARRSATLDGAEVTVERLSATAGAGLGEPA